MRLPSADLSPTRRLLAAALVTVLGLAVVLVLRDLHDLRLALGDTDDATWLTLMRRLVAGQAWWDERLDRYQPPDGVWMHWSRLLAGGLAALDGTFRLFTGPADAEMLTRIVWPLLWLFPATATALLCARTLAGRAELRSLAVLAAAVGAATAFAALTVQFRPGRVDHHDVQITLALVVLAGAMASGVRGAAVAGVATGLGLAVGLEALLFEAVLAASLGLRVWLDRREAPRAVAFGLALAGTTVAAYAVQTPPWRWTLPACDALGANLVAGAGLAGLGLAAAAWATRARAWPWRLTALAAAGGLALAVYLALDPHCMRGIFADVDPAIRPFWLDHVNEVKTLPRLWKDDRQAAVQLVLAAGMGLGAWAALGLVPARRRDPAWWTLGGALLLAIAAAATAVRMRAYLDWFAVAPLAVAAAELGLRARRLRPLATIGAAMVFAPVLPAGLLLMGHGDLPIRLPLLLAPVLVALVVLALAVVALRAWRTGWRSAAGLALAVVPLAAGLGLILNGQRVAQSRPAKAPDPPDFCYDDVAYRDLARLPAGVAVSEIDLGPFVVARTPSSTLSAPYHRMSLGIMRARRILVARDPEAQARAQAVSPGGRLGPVYLLECRRHRGHADRDNLAPDSLQARLDAGRPPGWLQRVSSPGAPIEIFRVDALPHTPPAASPR